MKVAVLRAGEQLGLVRGIGEREVARMTRELLPAVDQTLRVIKAENERYPDAVRPYLGGEIRLLLGLRHTIVPDMLKRLGVKS